jgi:hypothetical protein
MPSGGVRPTALLKFLRFHTARVISGHLQCNRPCPLYPRKRTFRPLIGMSAKGQKRTYGGAVLCIERRSDIERNVTYSFIETSAPGCVVKLIR